jgi:hypothetical protein
MWNPWMKLVKLRSLYPVGSSHTDTNGIGGVIVGHLASDGNLFLILDVRGFRYRKSIKI